jgi:soluble lytic murein transglycosylase-like protein
MQPKITFCGRCRGMRVGWNKRHISHRLFCERWLHISSRCLSLVALTAALLLAFPKPSASVLSGDRPEQPVRQAPSQKKLVSLDPVAVRSIDAFLEKQGIREADRKRLAEAIVASGRKHNLNPRLIASVMIVESRGNQFAISGKDAIGIMQIHLPTWGRTADREGVNLLKIEDNIDFGARILKNYIQQFGLWEGVRRYNGVAAPDPSSENPVPEYVARVQHVYEFQQQPSSQTALQ